MDNKTLITIVVTVAITTIVIGLLNWAYAILDAIIPISTTSARVKEIFSKSGRRAILLDVILFILWVYQTVVFIGAKSLITRWTIMYGVIIGIGWFTWLITVAVKLAVHIRSSTHRERSS
jgi:hypothetical protein